MPTLSDVVGALLGSLALGRAQADAQVLKIAQLYLADELLKNFPVPRVVLDEVEIELKLVFTSNPKKDRDGKDQLDVRITVQDLESVPSDRITTLKLKLREADRIWTILDEQTARLVPD